MNKSAQILSTFILFSVIVIFSGYTYNYNLELRSDLHVFRNFQYNDSIKKEVLITKDIRVGDYFQFIDSIVNNYDLTTNYRLTEHLLVRANPWIIDTLKNTDYYYMMKNNGQFVFDQKKLVVLPKNSSIIIPDKELSEDLLRTFSIITIDINIPEFKLRIIEDTAVLHEFDIRVGKNESKYLEMSGRVQDLKTKHGKGIIVAHVRKPRYVNPVNNYEYMVTKRDDDSITKLPQIPFIETEINGIRYGQLIHPTTNPVTLGKMSSNGCIGTKEGDAWVIYYYAPINTKIVIRYDLSAFDGNGDKLILKDIYNYFIRDN